MALKKVEKKVSLNIKVSEEMDFRLKRARKAARGQGLKFNVSKEVESILSKELKRVEKQLGLCSDITTAMNQVDFIDEIEKEDKEKVEN